MPITTKKVKGVKYLYFIYYDSRSKKKKEVYCGPENNSEAERKAQELEKNYLEDQLHGIESQLQAFDTNLKQRAKPDTAKSQTTARNKTTHHIVIGDCRHMNELDDKSVHLVIGSPPYFNAPFDYKDNFANWDTFRQFIRDSAKEINRVLDVGRIAAIVCDDTIANGSRYPIVSTIIETFVHEFDFLYRDTIIWRKPEGFIRKSRRSGVVIQNPYPMYFYTDNITEFILIFQKRGFNYKSIDTKTRETSKLDLTDFYEKKFYLNVWEITNVLPLRNRIEKDIAAFPYEIPVRLTRLYSYVGETVLDPWIGSGTTTKAALDLGRNSVGYEVNRKLKAVILSKLGLDAYNPDLVEIKITEGGRTEIISKRSHST